MAGDWIVRVFTTVAAPVLTIAAVLTAVGVIVQRASSESFAIALNTVLPYAGIGVVLLLILDYGRNAIRDRKSGNDAATVVLVIIGIVVFVSSGIEGFRPFGILALMMSPITISVLYWKHVRESRKTCPDCAETVKVEANVCRYCQFRFIPTN